MYTFLKVLELMLKPALVYKYIIFIYKYVN